MQWPMTMKRAKPEAKAKEMIITNGVEIEEIWLSISTGRTLLGRSQAKTQVTRQAMTRWEMGWDALKRARMRSNKIIEGQRKLGF
jgi:hypothetical protein